MDTDQRYHQPSESRKRLDQAPSVRVYDDACKGKPERTLRLRKHPYPR